jgi:uncharacterized membrane protein YqaE (UPF0057 family)
LRIGAARIDIGNQQRPYVALIAILTFYSSDICKIILAVILPPVGVFLERGCGGDFFINILLTILGYLPGIIHALYIILKY